MTGGDSGIGRAVTVAYAKEGAEVAVAYLCEDDDARRIAELVEAAGRRCVLIDYSTTKGAIIAFAETTGLHRVRGCGGRPCDGVSGL